MNKRLAFAVACALVMSLLALLATCAAERAKQPVTSFDRLAQPGIRIAVGINSPQEAMLARDYPNAELVIFNDIFPAYLEVANGRIDACVSARREMELAIQNGVTGVRLLDEDYCANIIAVGVSPVTRIPDLLEKLNAFIAEKRADGILDDMYERWVVLEDDAMPELSLPEHPSGTLRVGTTGTIMPYSYSKGTELAGYDIELARRFAAWLGVGLEFKVFDFGGIISAAQAGDIDCIMSNLYYSPEKAESIPFTDPLFEVRITAMVRDTTPSAPSASAVYASVDELNGKKIGSATGTTYDQIVSRRLPDVTFSYFNTYSDMVAAMQSGKIASFACDEPVLRTIMAENSQVTMMPEYLDTFEFGFIFQKNEKGSTLCGQMSEFIRETRESGELARLEEKWVGGHLNDADMPDAKDLGGENGTLTLAVDALNAPFTFMRGQEYAGYEIELAQRFCERFGYGLEIKNMDFDAVLASVQTDKADFGAATISITEERKQSVLFSEPHFSGGTVLAVLKADAAAGSPHGTAPTDSAGGERKGFVQSLTDSFQKTFLRENRWQLFTRGVLNTLVITLLSILLGTLLGFTAFMLCRNGNPAANLVARFSLWLVQGMPMVVLLMILYYIVFGSVAISGVAVAVLGFTLTFGASVFGLLRMGVGAVDGGQYEAAYALGYSNRRTFFRIILPQALPHVLPAYRGEVVGLIKATAVVGYIAVQDLTKMGDIVRSRTYEAFFPLIAVTVIYFLLEGLLRFMVSRIAINIDPARRKPGDILKGIKTNGDA